jgi:hypothetical protein
MDKDLNRIEPTNFGVEYVSLRQLNSERLKGLSGRFAEEAEATSNEPSYFSERESNPFESSQLVVPDEGKKTPNALQNIQRKFSTSWLNMQQYLGEKKQNRDWDARFK